MKIFKLSNDYAFQRKQKLSEKNNTEINNSVHQSAAPLIEQKNVEDKISGFREGNLGTEMQGEESKQEKETRKKKKEAGSKAEQLQEDCKIQ